MKSKSEPPAVAGGQTRQRAKCEEQRGHRRRLAFRAWPFAVTHPLPQVVLTLLLLFCAAPAAQAQQSTFFLNCAGTNDNLELDRVRTSIGSNIGTLRMTAKNGARCAVGNATIPAN